MELFNIENPYYEKWKPGRPSQRAIEKRNKYWRWEKHYSGNEIIKPNGNNKSKVRNVSKDLQSKPIEGNPGIYKMDIL